MEQKQPEWVQLFGAKIRTEHVPSVTGPLPTPIASKLQAIEDVEQRLRLCESEHTPGKRCTWMRSMTRTSFGPKRAVDGRCSARRGAGPMI
jgi:hypothetical protein